jgi:hypothetical protein
MAETAMVAGPTLPGCFVASRASPHRGSRLNFRFASMVRWHLTSPPGPLHPQDASTRDGRQEQWCRARRAANDWLELSTDGTSLAAAE